VDAGSVTIVKSVYGGKGLAYIDGKAVFVSFALPDEECTVRITRRYRDYDIGEIVEIHLPSPFRTRPLCPNFFHCGGCSYQHLSYDSEIRIKKSILLDSLKRIAGMQEDSLPGIELITGERYGYRSHAAVKTNSAETGFYQNGTNKIIPFPEQGCALLAPEINSCMKEKILPANDFRIAFHSEGVSFAPENHGTEIIEKEFHLAYKRDIGSFYQANRHLRPVMLNQVKNLADFTMKNIMDICCGVGFFSLYLAGESGGVTGYDIDKRTINYARKNAEENNITNARFFSLPSSQIKTTGPAPDIIIVDPPRSGMDKKTRRTVAALSPEKLIYVSCNPATFARDTRDLIKEGFTCTRLMLIDMFPCTYHIEMISLFTRPTFGKKSH